jgi:hypothetical protein
MRVIMLGFKLTDLRELISYVGAKLAITGGFGAGCLVLVYLAATDTGVSLSDAVLIRIVTAGAAVVIVGVVTRAWTETQGKPPAGIQPPPPDAAAVGE